MVNIPCENFYYCFFKKKCYLKWSGNDSSGLQIILILDMSKILDNIYDRFIAILFGTVFLVPFGNCGNLFLTKIFQNLIFMFSFSPKKNRTSSRKTSITQEWLVIENYLTPHWITFLIFRRLVCNITSRLNDLALVWNTLLHLYQKVSRQNSRLLCEIFQFLKQAVSVINFSDILTVTKLLLWNYKKG